MGMVAAFPEPPAAGPLSVLASRAGEGRTGRLQQALTRQLEDQRILDVDGRMRALPQRDGSASSVLRLAWCQRDRFSMQWVTAYPRPDGDGIEAECFGVLVCLVLGLPLGALRGRVGEPIPCAQAAARRGGVLRSRICDAFGQQLALAMQGGHWQHVH